MKRRSRILVAALGLVLLSVLVWLLLPPAEPEYQGKTLTVWLNRFHTNRWPLDLEAKAALQHFGTNAIPVMLQMMRTKESPVKMKLLGLAPKSWQVRLQLPTTNDYHLKISNYRRVGASGFMALGEQARPAVPELIALTHDKHTDVRYLAVFALRCLGPAARDALPRLIQCLDDPDFAVQDDAVMGLGMMHAQPELAVPAIVEHLPKFQKHSILVADSISALGMFASDAKLAVPTLLPYLNDQNAEIRRAATNALKAIDPEAAAKAGVE